MARILAIWLSTTAFVTMHAANALTHAQSQLPVVDLGYGLYQGSFNSTGNYYNFSNIRYAEPPVGRLRFAAPVPPRSQNRTIDDGTIARICPQAYPAGVWVNQIYNTYYSTTGKTGLQDFGNATQGFDYPRNTPQDPRITEDCLFLDVMVPREIFRKRVSGINKLKRGAAVMVWIHGGGYGAGTKYDVAPAGLISRSQVGGQEGVIFVALNYRLGALGWLSSPTFAMDGTPNAGLHDQRLALDWVKDNIHLFGGDRQRVTVFGESAGGGSIIHQITAFGGERGKVPFQRAILQSPGLTPMSGNFEQEQNFRHFLELLNVSTLEEARRLPSNAIQAASEFQIRNSKNGSWTYGPVVDGSFVPRMPGLLLMQNRFDRTVNVMLGHNGDEGMAFPSIPDSSTFNAFIESFFPNAPASIVRQITQKLYPLTITTTQNVLEDYTPTESKSLVVTGYNNAHGRQVLFISEVVINCFTYFVNKAFSGKSYAYFFTTPPALHGQELYYVFYNGQSTDIFFRPINITLAYIVQNYWTNFAQFGDPNGEGLPYFPRWGRNSSVLGLSLADIWPTRDPSDNDRCRWWQLGLYM